MRSYISHLGHRRVMGRGQNLVVDGCASQNRQLALFPLNEGFPGQLLHDPGSWRMKWRSLSAESWWVWGQRRKNSRGVSGNSWGSMSSSWLNAQGQPFFSFFFHFWLHKGFAACNDMECVTWAGSGECLLSVALGCWTATSVLVTHAHLFQSNELQPSAQLKFSCLFVHS